MVKKRGGAKGFVGGDCVGLVTHPLLERLHEVFVDAE
jgi:hypothetical protein